MQPSTIPLGSSRRSGDSGEHGPLLAQARGAASRTVDTARREADGLKRNGLPDCPSCYRCAFSNPRLVFLTYHSDEPVQPSSLSHVSLSHLRRRLRLRREQSVATSAIWVLLGEGRALQARSRALWHTWPCHRAARPARCDPYFGGPGATDAAGQTKCTRSINQHLCRRHSRRVFLPVQPVLAVSSTSTRSAPCFDREKG